MTWVSWFTILVPTDQSVNPPAAAALLAAADEMDGLMAR
jgi:hypothetical protein